MVSTSFVNPIAASVLTGLGVFYALLVIAICRFLKTDDSQVRPRYQPPASVTAWSICLIFGGLALFLSLLLFFDGAIRNNLLILPVLLMAAGYIAGLLALLKMQRKSLSKAWSGTLLSTLFLPLLALPIPFILSHQLSAPPEKASNSISSESSRRPLNRDSRIENDLRTTLNAAQIGDGKTFEAGLSVSLKAALFKEGFDPTTTFGDFSRVQLVSCQKVNDDTFSFTVEDRHTRRQKTLVAIWENNSWKMSLEGALNNHSATSPPNVKRVARSYTIQGEKREWKVTTQNPETGEPEELKLEGEMETSITKGSSYSALTGHVGGHPVFTVLGKGFCSYSQSSSQGRGVRGTAEIGKALSYELTENANQLSLANRRYDLTLGRVFLVGPGGAITQFPTRLKTLPKEEELIRFVETHPVPK